jgi:pilus assembly protein Flp/PilA
MKKPSYKNLITDNSGATSIEYGVIGLLISVTIVATIPSISSKVQNLFNTVAGYL